MAAGLEGLHGLRIEHKIGRKHIACGEPEHRPQPRQRAAKIRALRKSMKLIAARACPASARGRKRFKKASLICAPSPAVLSTTCPPRLLPCRQVPLQQRLALHLQQRFGGGVGQRAHAFPPACG